MTDKAGEINMKKPKTLFLFIDYEGDSFFFEKEGDYSHLSNTYINAEDDKEKEDELGGILWGGNYQDMLKELTFIIDKLKEPTKDWDFFVMCGIF